MKEHSADSTERAVLIIASVSSFITPFMSSSVTVALPAMGQQLSMGPILLGWVNMAYLLTSGAFLLPFGRLADIYGRKKINLWGVAVFMVASVVVALSVSAVTLLVGRVLQGFGGAMIFSTAIPILVSATPVSRRGRALGIVVACVYFGLSVGPLLGGVITQHLGWRYIFWCNVPLCLAVLGLTLAMVKTEWADAVGKKFDTAGSAILAAALLLTMYGFANLPAASAVIMCLAGLVLLGWFVRFETRTQSPLMEMAMFRTNFAFSFSTLAAFINYAATSTVGFLMSLYLQGVRGFTPQDAGLILVCQPVLQALISPLAGRLSDKHEPRVIASIGMLLTLIGLGLLVLLTPDSPIPFIMTCLGVLGLGFGLFSSPNTNAIMSAVEKQSLGVAGAMVSTARQIGMVFSTGVTIMAMTYFLGSRQITPANSELFGNCMQFTFGAFAVLSIGGVFASLARGTMRR
jgi:EmrB/QacA subfamily drug resistance transporter